MTANYARCSNRSHDHAGSGSNKALDQAWDLGLGVKTPIPRDLPRRVQNARDHAACSNRPDLLLNTRPIGDREGLA